jgi:hypothetical protein
VTSLKRRVKAYYKGVEGSRDLGIEGDSGRGGEGRIMSKAAIKTFKDLVVWRKSFELSIEIYRVSSDFPKHEFYGLASELRRTSGSIPYDIAEVYKRWSTVEYIRFLRILPVQQSSWKHR